jgi:cell division septal protein FtsQ
LKVIDVKKLKYQDGLAKKRQRRFLARVGLLAAGAIAILVGLGYVIFFSGWFDIRDLQIDGLAKVRETEVRDAINEKINNHIFGLPTGRNEIFLSTTHLEKYLSAKFTFIDSINADKKFFHGLIVKASERQSEGIWCFTDQCWYYDHSAVLISTAPRSSGFLTLTVNDERQGQESIDQKFLTAIRTILDGLEKQQIKVKEITIPEGTFTDLIVDTSNGYPVRFSTDTDLLAQLHALEIFRTQYTDPNPPYQYLDLRFDGRVYFK